MSDETVSICERCREVIDVEGPDVVLAFEQIEIRTFGGTDRADGLGAYFHERCFPYGSPAFRVNR